MIKKIYYKIFKKKNKDLFKTQKKIDNFKNNFEKEILNINNAIKINV